jgi:hypothetical protein
VSAHLVGQVDRLGLALARDLKESGDLAVADSAGEPQRLIHMPIDSSSSSWARKAGPNCPACCAAKLMSCAREKQSRQSRLSRRLAVRGGNVGKDGKVLLLRSAEV